MQNERKRFSFYKRYQMLTIRSKIAFLSIVLFFSHILLSKHVCIFWYIPDEMGYWLDAATFLGYNWSGMHLPTYYAGGYALLITPFLSLLDDPIAIYHAMHIVNATLNVISFLLLYKILHSNFVGLQACPGYACGIAFLAMCYPAYYNFTLTTQPECLLTCLTLCSILLMIHILQRQQFLSFIALGIVLGYMMLVHARSLPIIIATSITIMLYIFSLRKKTHMRWKAGIFFFILLFFFYLDWQMKNFLLSHAYPFIDLSLQGGALMHGNLKKILFLFSLDGLINFLRVLEGHLYYLTVSSLGLANFGLLVALTNTIHKRFLFHSPYRLFWLHIVLVILFSIIMSVIYFANGSETGLLYATYGRYMESSILAFSIAFGLSALLQYKQYKHIFSLTLVLSAYIIILYLLVINYYGGTGGIGYQAGLIIFSDYNGYNYLHHILFMTLIIISLLLTRDSPIHVLRLSCGFLAFLFLFNGLRTGFSAVKSYRYYQDTKTAIAAYSLANNDRNIYYYLGENPGHNAHGWWEPWDRIVYLQYALLKNGCVKATSDWEQVDYWKQTGQSLMTENDESIKKLLTEKNWHIITSNENYIIWH